MVGPISPPGTELYASQIPFSRHGCPMQTTPKYRWINVSTILPKTKFNYCLLMGKAKYSNTGRRFGTPHILAISRREAWKLAAIAWRAILVENALPEWSNLKAGDPRYAAA